jgi:hypothetical protein
MTMDFKESRVPLVIFLVGAAAALIGNFLSISIVTKAGFLCICLAIIALGIEMLVTGRAIFSTWAGQSWGHYERYSELPARLWGLLFLVFGAFLGLLTLSDVILPSGAEGIWAKFMDSPRGFGILLLGIGAIAVMYGIIRIIAGTALSGTGAGAMVSNFLERIWGGFVLLIGLGLALLGLVLIVAPDILLTPIHQVLQSIPTPPIPPER